MKVLGILFMLLVAATFTSVKGYSNPRMSSVMIAENHSEKMYIEPSKLYFSDEGVFIKTRSNEWRPIDHICYDVKGYYLIRSVLSNNPEICENIIDDIRENGFNIDSRITISTNQDNEQGFYPYGEEVIEYGSRVSPEPKKWKCPYCNHWWMMGEQCKNKDCPTNQWKKEDKPES